jgi:hypothetical protein
MSLDIRIDVSHDVTACKNKLKAMRAFSTTMIRVVPIAAAGTTNLSLNQLTNLI